jgi:hypothetical protein
MRGTNVVRLEDDTAVELDICRFAIGRHPYGLYLAWYDKRRVRRALRRFIKENPHMTAPLRHLNLSGRRFR